MCQYNVRTLCVVQTEAMQCCINYSFCTQIEEGSAQGIDMVQIDDLSAEVRTIAVGIPIVNYLRCTIGYIIIYMYIIYVLCWHMSRALYACLLFITYSENVVLLA